MRHFFLLCCFVLLLSCKSKVIQSTNDFSIPIETIFEDSISIRALVIDGAKVWYAGNQGKYGNVDIESNEILQKKISIVSQFPEFRSIAQNSASIFILNVGSPAHLYKISKQTGEAELVYEETDEKAFYDSMQFWNDQEGIAMGDPIADCLSVLITRDAGQTWQKATCENLPKTVVGEAAFAASNTNIIIRENSAWMVSGGTKSRVFYSADKGNTWEVFETPIVQGQQMTGIFSTDFYNENIGFAVGGNYEKPNQNYGNKALTDDGGKTWMLVGEGEGFGYASCVQFVPNSKGRQLVTVGFSGVYFSDDGGLTWKQLSDIADFHIIKFVNDSEAILAGKNKISRMILKK